MKNKTICDFCCCIIARENGTFNRDYAGLCYTITRKVVDSGNPEENLEVDLCGSCKRKLDSILANDCKDGVRFLNENAHKIEKIYDNSQEQMSIMAEWKTWMTQVYQEVARIQSHRWWRFWK